MALHRTGTHDDTATVPDRRADDEGAATPTDAIDDFRHLELTVTRVGFERVECGDDPTSSADAATGSDASNADAGTSDTGGPDHGDTGVQYAEYDVGARTVDLTGLRGPNATRIASFDVPPGTYRRAVAYVGHARGVLCDGTRVPVSLPAGPLAVARHLTVDDGGATSFEFDVVVRRTGDGYALGQASVDS